MTDPSKPWRVTLTGEAKRGLDRLPSKAAIAIVTFLADGLATNPERVSRSLVGDFAGLRSARVGAYRVLFMMEDASPTIRIVRIAHRTHVCRPD